MSIIAPGSVHGSMVLAAWNLKAVNDKTVSMMPYYKVDYNLNTKNRMSKSINAITQSSLILELPQFQITILPHARVNLKKDKAYIGIISEFISTNFDKTSFDTTCLSSYIDSLKKRKFFVAYTVPLYNLKCKITVESKSINSISMITLEITSHNNDAQPKLDVVGEKYVFVINRYINEASNFSEIFIPEHNLMFQSPMTVAHLTEVEPDKVNIIKECMFQGLNNIINYVIKEIN